MTRAASMTQTGTALVSNLDESGIGVIQIGNLSNHSQAFTTGGNASGYDVTSVDLSLQDDSTLTGAQTFTVRIHLFDDNATGKLGKRPWRP